MSYLYLSLAILSEVFATSLMKQAADQATWLNVSGIVVGYGLSFFLMALTLKTLPIGLVYAIWAGAGIALITLVGWWFYGQTLDAPAILGIMLIVAGVITIKSFSQVA